MKDLQTQLTWLTERNDSIINEVIAFNLSADKNSKTIAEQKRLVRQLKENIKERNQLVGELIDNHLVDFIKSPKGLNETERKAMVPKIDNRNLFDNIKFIKITEMSP